MQYMNIDRLIAEYEHANPAGKQKLLIKLSNHATFLSAGGEHADAVKLHSFIAHLEPASIHDGSSKAPFSIDVLANLKKAQTDPSALAELQKSPMAMHELQMGIMQMASEMMSSPKDLIDLSRQFCEEAGIPCPPSCVLEHQRERKNRPASDRIPEKIRKLVLLVGLSEDQADDLRPYAHPDNCWFEVMNSAVHNNDDADVYESLRAYVVKKSLCDVHELEHLPADRAAFVARKSDEDADEQAIMQFLFSNNSFTENALRELIAMAKKIHATTITLTDHPGYHLSLGIAEHNGKGTLPSNIDLVTGFEAWSESTGRELDDYWPEQFAWEWLRERWLAIQGPKSGLRVILFNNGIGDTMDLSTGEDGD
jgi:hypothetical protein